MLVLSPEYSEKHYPGFWSYNMAGMITDVEINEERTAMIGFRTNQDNDQRVFNDFDRIFDLAKLNSGWKPRHMICWGIQQGGQVLHRFAIFSTKSKANRILASNSGWYTVPTANENFPYGLKNGVSTMGIDFSKNLILFLGEKDDADETRGDLRHEPQMDKQGLFRFERGNYFYTISKEIATRLGKEFNWRLEVVPNVGHDYKRMGIAAAEFLYGGEE